MCETSHFDGDCIYVSFQNAEPDFNLVVTFEQVEFLSREKVVISTSNMGTQLNLL